MYWQWKNGRKFDGYFFLKMQKTQNENIHIIGMTFTLVEIKYKGELK